jgi:8-oxo-dGTP diphosphatase
VTDSNISVVGAVFVRGNAVLAFRRAPGKADQGKWEFPGGKIEPGETPPEALRRELVEELSVEVTVGHMISHSVTLVHGRSIELTTYEVAPHEEYPTHSTDHDEIRWLEPGELESVGWAQPDLPTVTELVAKLHG